MHTGLIWSILKLSCSIKSLKLSPVCNVLSHSSHPHLHFLVSAMSYIIDHPIWRLSTQPRFQMYKKYGETQKSSQPSWRANPVGATWGCISIFLISLYGYYMHQVCIPTRKIKCRQIRIQSQYYVFLGVFLGYFLGIFVVLLGYLWVTFGLLMKYCCGIVGGILWVLLGTFWYVFLLVFVCSFWYMFFVVVLLGTFWYFLIFYSIFWYFLVLYGT